jgi:hypothetical protein
MLSEKKPNKTDFFYVNITCGDLSFPGIPQKKAKLKKKSVALLN